MDNNLTLVILAAGMGSRFGGLKQMEPVGPSNEFIIDYSIHDAIDAGFNKVVFIIKEENYEAFSETIGKRIEPHIKVEYAFQKNDNIAKLIDIPKEREKPFGTAHALLCAKDKIDGKFAIISADDFYGKDSYVKCADYLRNNDEFCVIGYKVGETLSDKGSVKRGICMQKGDYLTDVIESKVQRVDGRVLCQPLSGSSPFEVSENHPVSMIMFGLNPSIFGIIEKQMTRFFEKNKGDLLTCEFLLPDVLDREIRTNDLNIKVIPTNSKWYGMTYREDLDKIKDSINKLVEAGQYSNDLWEKGKIKELKKVI